MRVAWVLVVLMLSGCSGEERRLSLTPQTVGEFDHLWSWVAFEQGGELTLGVATQAESRFAFGTQKLWEAPGEPLFEIDERWATTVLGVRPSAKSEPTFVPVFVGLGSERGTDEFGVLREDGTLKRFGYCDSAMYLPSVGAAGETEIWSAFPEDCLHVCPNQGDIPLLQVEKNSDGDAPASSVCLTPPRFSAIVLHPSKRLLALLDGKEISFWSFAASEPPSLLAKRTIEFAHGWMAFDPESSCLFVEVRTGEAPPTLQKACPENGTVSLVPSPMQKLLARVEGLVPGRNGTIVFGYGPDRIDEWRIVRLKADGMEVASIPRIGTEAPQLVDMPNGLFAFMKQESKEDPIHSEIVGLMVPSFTLAE